MMNWNELTKACLTVDLYQIGLNISMVSERGLENGLSESELINRTRNPTYTVTAEFHATECRECLRRLQNYIVAVDASLGTLTDRDVNDYCMRRQAFKGSIVDATNCIMGILAILHEMSGKKMTATQDAGEYLAKQFPETQAEFAVFRAGIMNSLSNLGDIMIQQLGKVRFFDNPHKFMFSIEDSEGNTLSLEPRELRLENDVVNVLPFLFILLLHLAKALDLTVKYYLLSKVDAETYEQAAKEEVAPPYFGRGCAQDELQQKVAVVFEKLKMDEALFRHLILQPSAKPAPRGSQP